MSNSWEHNEHNGAAQAPIGADTALFEGHEHRTESNGAPAPAPEHRTAAADEPANGNIDKIRDILFGGQMRDYESRFMRLEQALQREADEMREATRKRVDGLETYVKQELEALHIRFKNERDERIVSLSNASRDMKEMGEGISKRIAEVDDHSSSTHKELRDQLLQHGRDMTEQMHHKQREVTALLEQRFHELRKDKTDRAALSALFSEISMRLNNEFHLPGADH